MQNKTFYSMPLAAVLAVFLSTACVAKQEDLLRDYPCGPDSMKGPLRKLIPQGAFGADFKPACRAHDACYDTPGANKANCDAKYLQDMYCACSQSSHPVLCRMTARIMARATRKFGASSFEEAQKTAKVN